MRLIADRSASRCCGSFCRNSRPPRFVQLLAILFVWPPVEHLMLRAAVPHGTTAGALLELADGALHLVAGRPRALSQPDLLDVGTLAGSELSKMLFDRCHAGLQRATSAQHVGNST